MSRQEFIDAAREQAWLVDDAESQNHGRKLIGCRGSFTHADWDLNTVEAEILSATEVSWDRESFGAVVFGAQLKVATPTGQRWLFEVKAPEVSS